MVGTAHQVSVRLVRRSVVGDSGELVELSIGVGLRFSLVGQLDLGTRLVARSASLDVVQLRALGVRDDSTATGVRHIAEGSHTAGRVDTVGHRSGVAAHITRHVAREVGGNTVEGHVIGRTHGLTDGHGTVGDRHTRTCGEVGARLGGARTRVGHHTRRIIVAEAAVTTCIGSAHGGTAAGVRVVKVGTFRQVIRVVVGDAADRSGDVAGEGSAHAVEGHIVGRTHGLADGHGTVGDRHTRTCGEVGARLSGTRTRVGHHARRVVVAEAAVATRIGSADVGAGFRSARSCVGEGTRAAVVAEAAITTGVGSAHRGTAAGIRVVHVRSALGQVVGIVVSKAADRSGHITRHVTREIARDAAAEGGSTGEGGSAAHGEAIAHHDVVRRDHVVSDEHVTRRLDLGRSDGADLQGTVHIEVLKGRAAGNIQGRQYEHGHLRLRRNDTTEHFIEEIIVLDFSCNLRRAGGEVVNLALQARHVTVRSGNLIVEVGLERSNVSRVRAHRRLQRGDVSSVVDGTDRVACNGGVEQSVRSLTGQRLCVQGRIEVLVGMLQARARSDVVHRTIGGVGSVSTESSTSLASVQLALKRSISSVAVGLVQVDVGLERGVGRSARGGLGVDVRLQRGVSCVTVRLVLVNITLNGVDVALQSRVGSIAVQLILVDVGLQRGVGRSARGSLGVDVRLQRGVSGVAVGLVQVDVGLQRGVSRSARGSLGVDVRLQRGFSSIAVELILIDISLKRGIRSGTGSNLVREVGSQLGNDATLSAVEGVDAGIEGSLGSKGAGLLIGDGLRVAGNLIAHYVVNVPLVGEVVVGNRSLRAEHVTREGRATGRDVVADGQVVLDRHVRREDLTRDLQLDTRSVRSIHRNGGSHPELVDVAFRREHSSREIEVIVGLDQVRKVGEVGLQLAHGSIEGEDVAIVGLDETEQRGILSLACGSLGSEVGCQLGNVTCIRAGRTGIGGDVRVVGLDQAEQGGVLSLASGSLGSEVRLQLGNVTGIGTDIRSVRRDVTCVRADARCIRADGRCVRGDTTRIRADARSVGGNVTIVCEDRSSIRAHT